MIVLYVCIRYYRVKMASSTTAGVDQPNTATVVTATAGGPAVSDDRFDPFLPAFEPAVDELSLQQSMDVNKECEFPVYFYYPPPPPVGGRGIVFRQFLSLFLCQQHYEKTAGPICMKFSRKAWSDHGTT